MGIREKKTCSAYEIFYNIHILTGVNLIRSWCHWGDQGPPMCANIHKT